MGRIVGIDLGTTTSEIAYINNGMPEIIKNGQSGITPSFVGFNKNMDILVGEHAKNQYITARDRTVCEIKRKMGTNEHVLMAGKKFTPVEISAFILRELKKVAEFHLNESVADAVITVPANFNDAQRQATKEAGEKAGFVVKHIINEPTAAALAFGINNLKTEGKVLVYDLGGGTFDVTVLEMIEGSLDVIASRGLDRLGGKDFDEKIVDQIINEIKTEHDIDLSRDLTAMARIKDAAEKAKVMLSSVNNTSIYLPFIAQKDGETISFEMDVTREWYEDLIRDFIPQTMNCVDDALKAAKLSASDIDIVLAVGGSSRTPLIRSELERRFEKKLQGRINPDEAVALGAAVQAGLLNEEISADSIAIFDVCNHSLGISVVRDTANGREKGYFSRLILRDTHLPFSFTDTFTTIHDYQTVINVEVYQGESDRVENNSKIAEMAVMGIPVNKAGEEEIEITFRYNISGMLDVSAVIVSTGEETSISINMLNYDAPKSKTDSKLDEIEWENYSLADDIRTTVNLYKNRRENLPEEGKKKADILLRKLKKAVEDNDEDEVNKIDDELTALLFEY